LNHPFDAGDFFEIAGIEKYKMEFAGSREREARIVRFRSGDDYAALSSEIDGIKHRLREISEYGRNNALFQNRTLTAEELSISEEVRSLRLKKSGLQGEIERLVISRVGEQREKHVITYKNAVLCNTFRNMEALIPELGRMEKGRLGEIPIFTRAFSKLADGVNGRRGNGQKMAVVGGPCLLGTGEMTIRVRHRDGRSFGFDFNTRGYADRPHDGDVMGSHFRKYADVIEAVSFENKKKKMTLQDYEFTRMPIEFARALDAPVVIPLPDMSYMKYIDAVTSVLDRDIRVRAMEDFTAEMHGISDLFLAVIEELLRALRPPKLEVIHDRNRPGLDAFYNGRAPFYNSFISSGRGLKAIGEQPDMMESVADYIFYPGLPRYLWGIDNILQVDSLRETDSLIKCTYAHWSAISLHGALYPERLGKSGERPTSNTDPEDKEYMP